MLWYFKYRISNNSGHGYMVHEKGMPIRSRKGLVIRYNGVFLPKITAIRYSGVFYGNFQKVVINLSFICCYAFSHFWYQIFDF